MFVLSTAEQMAALVMFMAERLAEGFASAGVEGVPPWRSPQALLAKWRLGGAFDTTALSL